MWIEVHGPINYFDETKLLITDKAASEVRPTFDVDAIAEITSYPRYAEFSEQLSKFGFQEDMVKGPQLVGSVSTLRFWM